MDYITNDDIQKHLRIGVERLLGRFIKYWWNWFIWLFFGVNLTLRILVSGLLKPYEHC